MVESIGDLQGDPMLIPSSLSVLALYCFWQFLLLLAVFPAFSGFLVVWTCLVC